MRTLQLSVVTNKGGFVFMLTFGEWLKAKRTEAKMSQQALGDAVGITRAQISRLESGEQTTKNPTFVKICQALEINSKEASEGLSLLMSAQSGEESQEVTSDRDPEDAVFFANYDGLENADKEILRAMAARMNKSDRKKGFGGNGK